MNLKNDLAKQIVDYKDIFIFTDSDLDGTGSRILFEWFLEELNIKPVFILQTATKQVETDFSKVFKENIHSLITNSNKNCLYIFADLVPFQETIDLIQKYSNLWIFDHHLTSFESIGDFDSYFYHQDYSSCRIVYEYLHSLCKYNKVVDEFSNLVDIYDMWKRDNELFSIAQNINAILFYTLRQNRYSGYNSFVNKYKRKFELLDKFEFLPNEKKVIIEEEEKLKQDLISAKKTLQIRTDNQGNKYGFYKHYRKISEISSQILIENKELSYVIALNTYLKDQRKFSGRSQGFNVKQIAEKFGGGGHLSAAGFNIEDIETYEKFLSGEIHLL